MQNFSSLAGLEVAEKFLWGGGGGWFAPSFSCQTQPLLRLGWGFDNDLSDFLGGYFRYW